MRLRDSFFSFASFFYKARQPATFSLVRIFFDTLHMNVITNRESRNNLLVAYYL